MYPCVPLCLLWGKEVLGIKDGSIILDSVSFAPFDYLIMFFISWEIGRTMLCQEHYCICFTLNISETFIAVLVLDAEVCKHTAFYWLPSSQYFFIGTL